MCDFKRHYTLLQKGAAVGFVMTRRGFTLIELLIVISIIGILSAISIVALSIVAQNGRDAKRKTDLKVIQSALEYYYADQGQYPDVIRFGDKLSSSDGKKVYYNQLPQDPSYEYIPSPDGKKYCLKANLDNRRNAPGDNTNSCTDANHNYGLAPL